MLNCHRMPAAWDWGEWQGTSKSSAWHWVLLPWCRWRQMPEYCYTVKNAELSDFIKRIQGGIKHPPFLLFWPFLFVLLLFHAGIIGSRLTRGSMKNESVSVYSSVVVVHQSVLRWLRYPLRLCEKIPVFVQACIFLATGHGIWRTENIQYMNVKQIKLCQILPCESKMYLHVSSSFNHFACEQ